ncbi:MAG TPA: cryptochrome/photolyase family protein [Thiomicrospira sp.]|jgi:deoxyribodipyrimidine photolyase-related protein|nr:cryptochrome/photolyase family protein [Thiomicrospira sp.]
MKKIRNLCIVLGDQLNLNSALFDEFDANQDLIWMAEVIDESTHVKSHPQRIALFLSAMRHFAETLQNKGWQVHYEKLSTKGVEKPTNLSEALSCFLSSHLASDIKVVLPGEYRVLKQLKTTANKFKHKLNVLADRHFISQPGEFSEWMSQRKKPVMEYWVRHLRKRTGILMENGKPCGEKWNFDAKNRGSFGKKGPGFIVKSPVFSKDKITQDVLEIVSDLFANHSGSLASFNWPVTHKDAQQALEDFIKNRLALFGQYQDAMWFDEPFLYHSLLSSSLNLKLISPMEVIQAAEQAYHDGLAPIEAVEGFIRQILGWREFVRGLYWHSMPDWKTWNHLDAQQNLPSFYWTGKTDMRCLQQSISQVLEHGYGHHIQRLMITGLFAQLWETNPIEVHEWYLAMYVDAVEWVELPNVLGMSQYADGGFMASKPYVATGKYIQKMSPYCSKCQYKPEDSIGEQACPFTTLYWAFLLKHEQEFNQHPRMALQIKHLANIDNVKREAIQHRVDFIRKKL